MTLSAILKTCVLAIGGVTASFAAHATQLTMLTHYTDAQRAPLTACLGAYERSHPGIHVVQQQAEIDDYLQTVLIGRLSGTPPDIYNIYSVWAPQLVKAGVLDRPPAAVSAWTHQAFVSSTMDAIAVHGMDDSAVDGRTWGIPTEVSTFLLLYNKHLFRQAGLTAPPRDWNEVLADAAKITKRNQQGRITTAGFAFGPTAGGSVYPFLSLLLSRGVALFMPRDGGTNLASAESVRVLADTARLFEQGSTDMTIQVRDFSSNAVGMMIFANWYKEALREALGSRMDDTVGVAPIPAGDDWKTVQYAFFWAVAAESPHKAQAWDLLTWLNSAATAGESSCTGHMLHQLGALTGNLGDLRAEPADAFDAPFAEAIASGRARGAPIGLHGTEIVDRIRLMLEQVWNGHRTAAGAAIAADQDIRALLADAN